MKYRLNLKTKRIPFGGHHFRENGLTIRGDTMEEVVELLGNFRLINGKPIGTPKQDVINYYAEKFPWMVELDIDEKPEPTENKEYSDWREWIMSVWGKPQGKIITKKEASFRWEICKKCPHCVGSPWPETKESIEFKRKALLLRRGDAIEKEISFCDLHRADISVSSFVESPRELSRKPPNKPSPPDCWF